MTIADQNKETYVVEMQYRLRIMANKQNHRQMNRPKAKVFKKLMNTFKKS
ncbi:hypothetical protein [Acinetobacter sp. A47]|nr:hypothetical protein [Acinetobacter sp. A47]